MASVAYEQILEVQSLDLKLIQLRHRLATHPARAEVADADERIATIEAEKAEIEVRQHDFERTQKRLTDEVDTIEAKRLEIDGKLYGGTVTASKELLALQDEAAQLLARQTSIEDDQLVVMESMEGVSAELDTVEAAMTEATAARETASVALAAATADLDREIGEIDQARTDAASTANPELLSRYEELSPLFDGVAVARFVDGRCDGCHMQLSAVAADQLSKAPENAVVTCEECGRLLVR